MKYQVNKSGLWEYGLDNDKTFRHASFIAIDLIFINLNLNLDDLDLETLSFEF